MAAAAFKAAAQAQLVPAVQAVEDSDPAPTVWDTMANGPSLRKTMEDVHGFLEAIKKGYQADAFFSRVLQNPSMHKNFVVHNNFVYTVNRRGKQVLCLPRTKFKQRTTTQIIIGQAHETLGHFGAQKMAEYLRRWYWWPKMIVEVEQFCISCWRCQLSKPRNQLKAGLLHLLPIPDSVHSLDGCCNGLCWSLSTSEQIQLLMGNCMPTHVYGTSSTNLYQ